MSVKDLYDVRRARSQPPGSKVLADAAPAEQDAPTIARCRQAGFVFIGRTNMTEFAYSGLGLNPHHDTPRSPWDRETGRIPGGSSSGSAVSVADGMAAVTLGTDTGGSCRIPAAFNGITGFKPTASRVPLDGIVPLAFSLDSAGPLGRTVGCCAAVDAILAGEPITTPAPVAPASLHFAIPRTLVFDGIDDTVAEAFDRAVAALSDAGVRITDISMTELAELPAVNAKGGFAAAEAYAWHKDLLESAGHGYDPRVGGRIVKGKDQSAADYIDLLNARRRIIASTDEATRPVRRPAVPDRRNRSADHRRGRQRRCLWPDQSIVPPQHVGRKLSRQMFDFAALPSERPRRRLGLMLTGARGADDWLFRAAKTVEDILAPRRDE